MGAGSSNYFSGSGGKTVNFSGTIAQVNNGAATTVTITVTAVTGPDTPAAGSGVLALVPGTAIDDLAGNGATATFTTAAGFKVF